MDDNLIFQLSDEISRLKADVDASGAIIRKQESEIYKLREALKWYADEENWCFIDGVQKFVGDLKDGPRVAREILQ